MFTILYYSLNQNQCKREVSAIIENMKHIGQRECILIQVESNSKGWQWLTAFHSYYTGSKIVELAQTGPLVTPWNLIWF